MNSLIDNFNFAITINCKIGAQKHSLKKTDKEHINIYSIEDAKGLRDTAKNFCNYMKQVHPELTQIKKVKACHIQEWINNRADKWSNKTMQCHLSHIQKLERLCKSTFKSCHNDFSNVKMPVRNYQKRDRIKAMDKEDIEDLRRYLQSSKSNCRLTLEIETRLGLRALELSLFRSDYIDIENKQVILPASNESGVKGKRGRIITIDDKDIYFFNEIKRIIPSGRLISISEDSLNKGFRRALKDLGINDKYKNTTIHSIRKTWATERYNALKDKGYPDSIDTFNKYISPQLGHGVGRNDLYKVYIVNNKF